MLIRQYGHGWLGHQQLALSQRTTVSELIAIENRIAYPNVRLPGFVGVGVSIAENRVKVGFEDTTTMSQSMAFITAMGVPGGAIILEVWGQPRLTATFKDKLRPMFGGIQIGIMNRDSVPWDNVLFPHDVEGSIGYDVHTTAGVHYMLTAAHINNQFRGVVGGVGDTILQKGHHDAPHGIYPVGKVAINPAWETETACPVDSTTQEHFNYCTHADAMLVSYLPGVTYTRGVGVSTYEGLNGAAGNQNIREAWGIVNVWPPEMVRSGVDGVHKSGMRTGTTTGVLDLPLFQENAVLCLDNWGASQENMDPGHSCITGLKTYRLENIVKVNTALALPGDSGGPVFAGNGSPYHALGIVTGARGGDDGTGTCTGQCYFFFSKWSEIEARLGVGSLNPITGQ